jgi:hypothetical protein
MHGVHVIPSTLLTSEVWTDTGKITGTYSQPRWVENATGDVALRKPGRHVVGGLEAAREVVASHIGRWLGVNISTVELIAAHPDGPCCVSWAIPGPVIPFRQALLAPFTPATVRAAAAAALPQLGRAIVLDALLGNCDRLNDGNIVFAEAVGAWYTLDYSLSFNLYQPTQVGDPSLGFGVQPHLRQTYYPAIIDAVRLSPGDFQATVALAETITEDEIERLFALLPAFHASAADAGSMRDFVKIRRSAIRAILRAWCALVNLGGTI